MKLITELRQLQILRLLRDEGTLTAAARRLHLTPSALSHTLGELETRLGAPLYVRKRRPAEFTAAGRRLLRAADELLPQLEEAERDIQRELGEGAGRLHIAIECHSCFDWLLPTLDAYRGDWPEVEIDLSLGFSFEPLPALLRGELDVVITSDPVARADIAFVPLFRFQGVLVMATDHRLADREWIEPEDLADEVLITYPVEEQRLDVYRNFLWRAGVQPRQRRTVELTLLMLQLVASGRGVAALPEWAVMDPRLAPRLVHRPLGREGFRATLYCAVRAAEARLPYLKAFLDCARRVSFATLDGIEPVGEEDPGPAPAAKRRNRTTRGRQGAREKGASSKRENQ